MKKLVAIMLALLMVLPASGIMLVSAAEYTTFSPSETIGETTGETEVSTGVNGVTMYIGADNWQYGTANITSENKNTYKGYMVGVANPNVDEKIGTYYSFKIDDSIETGSLELVYQQSNKSVYIKDDGTALPDYNGVTSDTKIDLASVITVKGGHTYTLYANGSKLRFYGFSFKELNPQQEFAEEISKFSFDAIKGENEDQNRVDSDLNLIQNYESQFGSCDLSWTTTNPDVIANDGTVNCQQADTVVKVTGTFSVQEDDSLVASKSFDITVLADTDDELAVSTAKAALTLGETSSVRNNLTLPAKGKKGTTITWSTSDPGTVENNGTVHPASGVDKTATLTATISRGEVTDTKEFTIIVKGIVVITIESYSYADKDGNPHFVPVDGGKLKGINVTLNNPNPIEDDNIIAAVYNKDGNLTGCRMIPMSTVEFGKSMPLDIDLNMNSTDTFKIFAMNTGTAEPYINQPYSPDDELASGAKIYVVGDSTASKYDNSVYPRTGWAQVLQNYFDGVSVVDLALSGKSSVDFKIQTNYTTLKNSIKSGDYLIIQFGHNDSKRTDTARFTDPFTDRFTDGSFKKSMLEYVELAWERGARPIIATSISRRRLTDNKNDPTGDPGLEWYAQAAKELAAECNIPCIDLYKKTNGWINEVDLEDAKDMFNWVKPYDSRYVGDSAFKSSTYYKDGYEDNTHLNIYGANLIAQWAADEMKEIGIPIGQKRNTKIADSLPSYADATSVTP